MPHTYTQLFIHIVFSTKNRLPLITKDNQERIYEYLGGTIRGLNGSLIEVGGIEDHIHILTGLKPTIAPADFLMSMKPSVSKWAKREIIPGFEWQTGYGAFSVSPKEVDSVCEYIHRQEEHHKGLSYEDEFVELCEENGMEIDRRYLWT